jgi:2',3'-cyclic-nucleotide 2'-phosphodiesterase/3'-nucleotidase
MRLTIIATSDLHGEYGRFQTIAKHIRQRKPDLLIDNGDMLQGSLLDAFCRKHPGFPHPMVELANDLGYDCAVFGNHEFQEPPGEARLLREACRFPWISGNIGDVAKPYVVKTVRGVKAAVLGLTTAATPCWDEFGTMAHLRFESAAAAARRWVKRIRETENPDFLVVSYHGGFAADPDGRWRFGGCAGENEAEALLGIPGIDLIITGHQHLCLLGEKNGIPYVQPGSHGRWFAELEAVRENGGWTVHGRLVPVAAEEPLPAEAEAWLSEPVGHVGEDLRWRDPLKLITRGHPYLDWFHRFQLGAAGAELSVTELFFRESGGFHGLVTRRDILANYPRDHRLVVLELAGRAILAALEQSAAALALNGRGAVDYALNVDPGGDHPFLYDHWGGLTFRMDLARPVGARISDVRVKGEPLDPDRTYAVAMNSFRALGNEFPMYRGAARRFETDARIPDLLEAHIRRTSR